MKLMYEWNYKAQKLLATGRTFTHMTFMDSDRHVPPLIQ